MFGKRQRSRKDTLVLAHSGNWGRNHRTMRDSRTARRSRHYFFRPMPLQKLGPYRLDRVLGRGGMGSVYAGVNEETGERAAIKVLASHLVDDANFVERFKAEVETLKK